MYRIMIADDEGIVIDSMKFIIEKEFNSMCQVEYAKTGRSVIELAERFRPDIAFMDIQMPGINGIDAMKEIQKFSPDTVFIVMSAYDKFDYAQESIKLGVIEYINKPMEKTKVVATLKNAMDIIDSKRKQHSENLLIKEKLETVEPIIENGLIYNILFKEDYEDEVNNYKTMLGIQSDYGYMMSLICGENQEGSRMTNAMGTSVKISMKYVEVRECVKQYFNCKIGSAMANKIAILVPYPSEIMDYNERIALIERARELIRVLKFKEDISFRIGIGKVKKLNNLGESYSEALSVLNSTTGTVAHADDVSVVCEYENDYPVDIENKLFEAVSGGSLDDTLIYADKFLDWIFENENNNIDALRLRILEFTLWAERMAYLEGGVQYGLHSRDNYIPEITMLNNRDNLSTWFKDKLSVVCHNMACNRAEKTADVIKSAEKYIKENFSKEISLDDVSRFVCISPYYFSKLFKDEKGVNFIEYLTKIRISKAKELIEDGGYSMKEICSMCGYQDPNYFSRTFKKNVGISPSEYKDMKK